MFDLQSLLKYLMEGLAVAVAAFLIPRKTVDLMEIGLIGLTAAAVFAVLDQFAPLVGQSTRQGAGFGIGLQQVGWGVPEGFEASYQNPSMYEGYDDYEHAEGFAPGDTVTPPEVVEDKAGVCRMDGTTCGYETTATDDQKSKYVCVKQPEKCEPINACRVNANSECEWSDNAKDANGVDGRTCISKDVDGQKTCSLGVPSVEGFSGSSNDIQGFEGFSKVF